MAIPSFSSKPLAAPRGGSPSDLPLSPLIPPPTDLGSFPSLRLERWEPVYRIHRAALNPWWFSSSGLGRFDLRPASGSPPWMGTCYFAREPLGCLIEVFREGALISESELEALRISRLLLPFEANLADCTSSLARSFGVTAEIHSTPDYTLPHTWAAAFSKAGFHGIHYYLRHDPEQRLTGIALFGPAGVGTPASGFIHDPARPIGLEILKEAQRRFGMVVVPTY